MDEHTPVESPEVCDWIDAEIDFSVEEKHRKEWLKWKQLNNF